MGQKVHPLGFRLGITQKHFSQWFVKPNQYSQLVLEDHFLRKFIKKQFPDVGIVSIEIQRKVDQIKIEVSAARPRILVNFGGQDLESLRQLLAQKLKEFRVQNLDRNVHFRQLNKYGLPSEQETKISIHVTKLANPNTSAAFLADFLAEQLEKRVPFRRAMKSTIQRAERAKVPGIKIQVSGRLNGAEIARSEWIRKGRVPLQTLRANMEYNSRTAKTIYGLLGIKIWLFQGLSATSIPNSSNVINNESQSELVGSND